MISSMSNRDSPAQILLRFLERTQNYWLKNPGF